MKLFKNLFKKAPKTSNNFEKLPFEGELTNISIDSRSTKFFKEASDIIGENPNLEDNLENFQSFFPYDQETNTQEEVETREYYELIKQ